jgi:hypothetical protein
MPPATHEIAVITIPAFNQGSHFAELVTLMHRLDSKGRNTNLKTPRGLLFREISRGYPALNHRLERLPPSPECTRIK